MKRVLITILFLGMTAIIMQAKTYKEQIETLYQVMYKAMMAKDMVTLNRIHADDFVLTHMKHLYSGADVTPGGCSFISTFPREKAGGMTEATLLCCCASASFSGRAME